MNDAPRFQQVNIIVSDMDAAAGFYRRLGVELQVGPADWPAGSGGQHAGARSEPGLHLDLDNQPMARIWGDRTLAPGTAVIGFSVASRQAVDEIYADVTAAGYAGLVAPYDAFFGSRYAIVEDPDGLRIGLMSPIDPAQTYTPTFE